MMTGDGGTIDVNRELKRGYGGGGTVGRTVLYANRPVMMKDEGTVGEGTVD